LLVAAFLGPLVLYFFGLAFPSGSFSNLFVIVRELSVFLVTGILLVIVISGEKQGLDSIGLHNRHWGKSLLWALVTYILCMATALLVILIFKLTGIKDVTPLKRYSEVSPWVMSLMMLRAGVFEEICYRGYMMERLAKLSGKWPVYFLLPSVLFGLLHYVQGPRGMMMAFALSMVLSFTYWKKRDLKANIIAHFSVDFVSNVLVPLLS
jgi:membrane protease YdiL (CAAX protease family)